jgi:hypothetical protein
MRLQTPPPQMALAEFKAALKRHGFRVVRAKIEDATDRALDGRPCSAVARSITANRSRRSSPFATPSLPGVGSRPQSSESAVLEGDCLCTTQ